MTTESHLSNGRGPGYEVRDTNIRVIMWFGLALVILVIVLQLSLWGMLKIMSGGESEPVSPLIAPDVIHAQRQSLTIREKVALEGGYGVSDKASGTYKMPIEDAMKIVANRGIPLASKTPRTSVDVNSHDGKPASKDSKPMPESKP